MTITFISEPNKHIEEYFDYYFDGKKNFEYAILLNGAWGSGKTWFVKKYLEKKEDQKKYYEAIAKRNNILENNLN